MPGKRSPICAQGDREARNVGDVLAKSQFPIDVVPGDRLKLRVLISQSLGPFGKGLLIGIRPPIAQVSFTVVLRTLVIEPMADLMTDDGSDGAVVDGIVGAHREERRLQDRSREHDLVHLGVVVGIDHLRRHEPLVAIHRVAKLGDVAIVLESTGSHHVGDQVARAQLECGIVAPRIGVADLGSEGGELLVGRLLGFGSHPFEFFNRIAIGGDEVVNQGDHARFVLRREVPINVDLTQGLTHGRFDEGDSALPPCPLTGHAT